MNTWFGAWSNDGCVSEGDKTYFHTVVIEEDAKEIDFAEKVVEEEIGKGNE